MNFSSLTRTLVFLGVACWIPSCREQKVTSPNSLTVPEGFELDFDKLFDLSKPNSFSPGQLEEAVASLAVVPREKLCKPVKLANETGHYHWFSPKDAPVHNPVYSIFGSQFRPNFVGVSWQDQDMERIYCVYPAEKDQQVPHELLADIDRSLKAPHTLNSTRKQYEWQIEHYRVTAEYSNSFGKGDPCFLINIHNKAYKAKPRLPASSGPVVHVNFDDFFDWKNPEQMTLKEFQKRIQTFEEANKLKIQVKDEPPRLTYFFSRPIIPNGTFSIIERRYQASNAYFQWTDGKISNIRVSLPPVQNGNPLNYTEELAHLDDFFGKNHHPIQSGMEAWQWTRTQIRFYKYSNSDSYCIEFDDRISPPLASAGLPAPITKASAPIKHEATPPAPAVMTVPSPASFKLRLTQVNGLLISQLSSGEEAGQVTKMTLTALPRSEPGPTTLEFNQKVGQDMLKSIGEVAKLSQLRHPEWPSGQLLQVGFEDKYIDKDGPSAAVACALLVESAVTGKAWDPAFAVTGDLNADGSVQPIGGVRAKIRGATKGNCSLVAIPTKNEKSIPDLVLLDGPAPLFAITVFSINTFDDAVLLASSERPKALADALLSFQAMRPALERDPRQTLNLLRTAQAQSRLQALLQAAPYCLSAKYLLLFSQGRLPRTLSIGGSIQAAQSGAVAIINSIENDVESNVNTLKPDEVGTSLNKLRNLRPLLDPRVWPYVDGLINYGDVVRGAILNPVRSGARFVDLVTKARKAASSAQAALKGLLNNVQVREELGL